ncbi:fungal-specific transcription factor domain-containing protein [Multifurca ochricompacta]|uniref:Fungal-specific transcription factor domain-containing protein n=1 Tax=Multifurca ochricompacta TaxID=376703 RepID=A0AAD4M8Q1_9AGAM|nr:fungal-specific transcription factor domain-containing protein [Multifurca ochricompacta]
MSARIKQLEATLARAPHDSLPLSSNGDDTISQDPLKDAEPGDVKYESDLDSVSMSLGSLAIDGEGKAQYYGETAGAEFLQNLMPVSSNDSCTIQEPKYLGLPYEILELVHAFPFGLRDCAHMMADFVEYIPFRERANELANLYYLNAAWLFDPVPRPDLEHAILEPLYSSTNGVISLIGFEPHRLSVFFMVLSTGALFDSHPNARTIAEQYHAFACATFSLESIVGGATCASAQALLMMAHFLFLTDRSGNERRWLLNGLCTKVIHMIGLQRDSAGWNLSEEEVQRRRTIFWEFFTWECWASVLHGRPPTLNLTHSDCRFPRDLDPYLLPSGNLELGFHSWKFRYSAACLSVSVQRAFSVHQASYSSLLELDKRIRSFPLPAHLFSPAHEAGGRDWDTNPNLAMQQFFPVCERESNLIYIHRCWFAEALRDSPDPIQHEYGQSVVTVYRSANILINGLKSLTSAHPRVAGRVWFFWSSFYTSSILLGAIVVKSPGSKLARSALTLLDQSLAVYEEGSRLCRPAATMPMLERLRSRAHHTYSAYCATISGGHQAVLPLNLPDDIHDLSAFGGTKGGVINKSPSNSPHGSNAPSPDSTLSGDISTGSVHPQRSSHSPLSLSHHSPLAYSSNGSSPPHQPDTQAMGQISYGSIPSAGMRPPLKECQISGPHCSYRRNIPCFPLSKMFIRYLRRVFNLPRYKTVNNSRTCW